MQITAYNPKYSLGLCTNFDILLAGKAAAFSPELPPFLLGFLLLCPLTIYTSCKYIPIILTVCLVLPLQALISVLEIISRELMAGEQSRPRLAGLPLTSPDTAQGTALMSSRAGRGFRQGLSELPRAALTQLCHSLDRAGSAGPCCWNTAASKGLGATGTQ